MQKLNLHCACAFNYAPQVLYESLIHLEQITLNSPLMHFHLDNSIQPVSPMSSKSINIEILLRVTFASLLFIKWGLVMRCVVYIASAVIAKSICEPICSIIVESKRISNRIRIIFRYKQQTGTQIYFLKATGYIQIYCDFDSVDTFSLNMTKE